MEIILLERVRHLGQMGEVVNVKPGYARNYLLPQGKALRANKENLAFFEARKAELEAKNEAERQAAQSDAAGIEGVRITLIRQASETGHLYGSVSTRDIANELTAQGHKVAHTQVILDHPIKTLGVHEVLVHLHAEVEVTISVNVARSEQEAEAQVDALTNPAALEEIFESEELAAQAEEEIAESVSEDSEEAEVEAEAEAEAETAESDEDKA
jgi:large subunit ribosomal protein L9